MKINAFIPARMKSSRFPGKPLIKLNEKTMIEHVWSRTKSCQDIDEVFIATCDNEIQKEAINFGARVIMTSDKHEMCMTRIVEAATKEPSDITITVQGDEPLIRPEMISETVKSLKNNSSLDEVYFIRRCVNVDRISARHHVKNTRNKYVTHYLPKR